ncbi:hypothetical protein H0E87_021740, partial [Populus deltoides]
MAITTQTTHINLLQSSRPNSASFPSQLQEQGTNGVETQLPPHFASAAASPHHSAAVSSSFSTHGYTQPRPSSSISTDPLLLRSPRRLLLRLSNAGSSLPLSSGRGSSNPPPGLPQPTQQLLPLQFSQTVSFSFSSSGGGSSQPPRRLLQSASPTGQTLPLSTAAPTTTDDN